MKRILTITLALVTGLSSMFLSAQEENYEEKYFPAINRKLTEGDCKDALRLYNVYKEMSNRTDKDIERRIAECNENRSKDDLTSKYANQGTHGEVTHTDIFEHSKWFLLSLYLPIKSDNYVNPVSFSTTIGTCRKTGWYANFAMGWKFYDIPEDDANFHFSLGPSLRLSESFMLTGGVGYCVSIHSYLPYGFVMEAGVVLDFDGPMLSLGYENIGFKTNSIKVGFGWRLH